MTLALASPTGSFRSAPSAANTGSAARSMSSANRMGDYTLPPEIDHRLEQMLIDWWLYEKAYRGAPAGAHASTIYAELYRSRSGYDSASDMMEEDVNYFQFDAISGAVASLSRDHRESIEIKMMCFTSAAVWRSNRLGNRIEALFIESKSLLLPMLRKRRVEI